MSLDDHRRLLLIACAVAAFASFTWAARRHFRRDGPAPPGMVLIAVISLAGFAWFSWRILTGRLAPAWPVGVALFIASFGLFSWAVSATRATRPTLAFSPDQPRMLIRHGPYRYIRHPFYSAYVIFWTGTALATSGWAAWCLAAVIWAVYLVAARREEMKFAGSDLALAYAGYRAEAGMFLPRLIWVRSADGRGSLGRSPAWTILEPVRRHSGPVAPSRSSSGRPLPVDAQQEHHSGER